jgi:hypothetical protein
VINGEYFDSRLEARRYQELLLLERAGKITELYRQVEFELIPAQYEEYETGEIIKRGPLKGQPRVKRRCLEKACKYIADFTYIDENGEYIVEDTKGDRTDKYIIKRKLMLYLHGIKIREVTRNERS